MFGTEAEHSGILWCHPAGECCGNRALFRRLGQRIASEMDCLLEPRLAAVLLSAVGPFVAAAGQSAPHPL
jgi:hypothetical protein